MYIRSIQSALILLCSLFLSFTVTAAEKTIKINKAANWIVDHAVSMPASIPTDNIEGGV